MATFHSWFPFDLTVLTTFYCIVHVHTQCSSIMRIIIKISGELTFGLTSKSVILMIWLNHLSDHPTVTFL